MPSSRRAISNLGDVQIALNNLFDQVDALNNNPQDLNQRILTGLADPKKDRDAVNYQTLKDYVASQIIELKKLIPNKQPIQPPDANSTSFNKNIVPKTTLTYSIGSSVLAWLKGWFGDLNVSSLTASRPVKTDGSKNLSSGKIDLAAPTTDVQNTLGVPNGGTGQASLTLNSVLLGNGISGIQVQAGVSGALTLTLGTGTFGVSVTLSTVTLQYKDWTGVNQSQLVVTGVTLNTASAINSASLTTNNFTNGVRST